MRRVVADLGCADRNGADSVAELARKYEPMRLYGFDPSPAVDTTVVRVGGVPVTLRRRAAWLHNGTVSFYEQGSGSMVNHGGDVVDCFDFSEWLAATSEFWRRDSDCDVIVKMDIEHAEVPLLERLMVDGTDRLITELLVEWHSPEGEALEPQLRCPVRRWWL